LEPAAGDGAIIRAVARMDVTWIAAEKRAVELGPLFRLTAPVCIVDFLAWQPPCRLTVAITNPPYSLAMEFVEHALTMADNVAMLLRLNFLASEKRAGFMRAHPPDVYVLPNRPSFTPDGKTDSIEYAWFVWPQGVRRTGGMVRVLAPTAATERRVARPGDRP